MKRPRVLFVHNAYQHRGGEDSVVDAEIALLENRGHDVTLYLRDNTDIPAMGAAEIARDTLWSRRTWRELRARLRQDRPDVIHAHNTFPLISPSLYWIAESEGIPVVQTLHNFRILCLNGLFLRKGNVCEDCMNKTPWRGVTRGCYRDSRAASAGLAAMLVLHRGLGTFTHKVARYIALNEFCRRKFIEGGLPSERLVVKPNFVDFDVPVAKPRAGLLFVGRLSTEKGVETLARAMAAFPAAPLRVAGDGPQAAVFDGVAGVTRLGRLPAPRVREEMARALALVVPSICFETFGLVVVEAFACGTPVIVSNIGALADIVQEGVTGLLFEPGNAQDLAEKVAWALARPNQMAEMGRRARSHYEAEFSADVNYHRLIEIYTEAIGSTRDAVHQV